MPVTVDDLDGLLSVPRLDRVPGVRAFERTVQELWDSTEILNNAFDRAAEHAREIGRPIAGIFPDWEAIRVSWDSFVGDVRDFAWGAVSRFRRSTREAVDRLNALIVELDEWLGFTAMWSELREWVLRELRSFRGGRTLRERLDRTEEAAGRTFAIAAVAATVLVGLGAWIAWVAWKRRTEAVEQVLLAESDHGRTR